MYKYVLFDFDGTLTDPGIGITNSGMYALEKFGIEVNDRTSLYKFIGPPLLDSFQNYYGFTKEVPKTQEKEFVDITKVILDEESKIIAGCYLAHINAVCDENFCGPLMFFYDKIISERRKKDGKEKYGIKGFSYRT